MPSNSYRRSFYAEVILCARNEGNSRHGLDLVGNGEPPARALPSPPRDQPQAVAARNGDRSSRAIDDKLPAQARRVHVGRRRAGAALEVGHGAADGGLEMQLALRRDLSIGNAASDQLTGRYKSSHPCSPCSPCFLVLGRLAFAVSFCLAGGEDAASGLAPAQNVDHASISSRRFDKASPRR